MWKGVTIGHPQLFAIGRRLAQYLQNIPKLYRLQAFCG